MESKGWLCWPSGREDPHHPCASEGTDSCGRFVDQLSRPGHTSLYLAMSETSFTDQVTSHCLAMSETSLADQVTSHCLAMSETSLADQVTSHCLAMSETSFTDQVTSHCLAMSETSLADQVTSHCLAMCPFWMQTYQWFPNVGPHLLGRGFSTRNFLF